MAITNGLDIRTQKAHHKQGFILQQKLVPKTAMIFLVILNSKGIRTVTWSHRPDLLENNMYATITIDHAAIITARAFLWRRYRHMRRSLSSTKAPDATAPMNGVQRISCFVGKESQVFASAKGSEFRVKSWVTVFLLGALRSDLFQYLYMKIRGIQWLRLRISLLEVPSVSSDIGDGFVSLPSYMCVMESPI